MKCKVYPKRKRLKKVSIKKIKRQRKKQGKSRRHPQKSGGGQATGMGKWVNTK